MHCKKNLAFENLRLCHMFLELMEYLTQWRNILSSKLERVHKVGWSYYEDEAWEEYVMSCGW